MTGRSFAVLGAMVAFAFACPTADAAIRITEWMYSGAPGEFVELTNVGGPAVDFTGWSYSDEDNVPGTISLSSLGVVAPGESVLFTDALEGDFRTGWSLPAGVKILGEVTDNLSRNDAIYIYDAANAIVDVLDYGDQSTPGAGPRTADSSGNPMTLAALGANNPALWVLSSVGDAYGSYAAGGSTGNPGSFSLVPEPAGITLAAIAAAMFGRRRRRS